MESVTTPSRVPTYRERLAAGIQRYTPRERGELVAFRQRMHGGDAPTASPEYARWMWEAPGRRAPELWVYRHEGRVVAQQGTIPVSLQVGDRSLEAAWAVHLLVEPAHQLRGIGATLSQRCFLEHEVLLGLEVSDAARRSFRRAGWIDLGTVPVFARIISPRKALAERWPGRRWTSLVGRAADMSLGALDAFITVRAATRPLDVEPVERFDTRVDFLWERARRSHPVIARRDHGHLNWRFADYPDPRRYRRLLFTHRGEVVGWAVLRVEARGEMLTGHIVDWLAAPDWAWFVLAKCLTLLERWGAHIVYCLHLGTSGARALRQLGFVERDSGWPLMFRAKELPSSLVTLLCRRDSWFVTAGDSDVDRPRDHTTYPPDAAWDASASSPRPAVGQRQG
jgi:hypothetical protein